MLRGDDQRCRENDHISKSEQEGGRGKSQTTKQDNAELLGTESAKEDTPDNMRRTRLLWDLSEIETALSMTPRVSITCDS